MLLAVMAVPAVPVAGPVAVTVGEAWPTTVSDIVAATGRVRRVVVGVAAVGGVPPVVAGRRRREAGRRVVGGVAGDRGPVPTVVPPVVQVVGAVAWGPKTLKVMVPVALEPEEAARAEVMLAAAMAVPAVPVAGPLAVDRRGGLGHDRLGIVEPQVEVAVLLLASPP